MDWELSCTLYKHYDGETAKVFYKNMLLLLLILL